MDSPDRAARARANSVVFWYFYGAIVAARGLACDVAQN